MNLNEEYFACLALRHTPGLGPKSWSRILNYYGSAYDAVKDASGWDGLGFSSSIVAEAAEAEKWRGAAESEFKDAIRLGFGLLPWTHPAFPSSLKEIPDPPPYLYYYGEPSLLNNPSVAVVGARKGGSLGLQYAKRISRDLSDNGITVVSGFARGVDASAHTEALKGIGSTIAVLGTGLDIGDYPRNSSVLRDAIMEKGLIISEFTPGTRPYSGNFPFRNRLISGLSAGVLVVEADIKSGSLITARLAAEQGREVMALPGPPGSKNFSGCLKLIKEGAALVETMEDILMNISHAVEGREVNENAASAARIHPQAVRPERVERNKIFHGDENDNVPIDINKFELSEHGIAYALASGGKLHIDEIARSCDIDVSKAAALVLGMEVKGTVVRFSGMYYALTCS